MGIGLVVNLNTASAQTQVDEPPAVEFGQLRSRQLAAGAEVATAKQAGTRDKKNALVTERDATIVLHVTNYAALSSEILKVAKARVASVYDLIRVHTVWVDGVGVARQRRNGPSDLTVLLLSRDMAARHILSNGIGHGVLGQAHLSSGRAYIFCDRIATTAGAPRYFPTSLGDIIAHEVGHLLLRTNSHSHSGIMRAKVDVHAFHLRGFDKTQAETIRDR